MQKHFCIPLAGVLASFSLAAHASNPPTWQIENVARASAGNRKVTLKVTPDQRVHLAYTGCTDDVCDNAVLEYAVREPGANGTWSKTIVDDSHHATGWFSSMVITPSQAVHILYSNHYGKPMLQHAILQPGKAWTTDKVSNIPGGYWISTELSGDQILMSSTAFPKNDLDHPQLEFGTFGGDEWAFEKLDDSEEAGWLTALAVDNQGQPVISYVRHNYPEGDLMVTHRDTGNQWKTDLLDHTSVKSDLAVDRDGFIHVVYQKYDPNSETDMRDLMYATNSPDGAWHTQILDGAQDVLEDTGGHPHITIDANGTKHVSYSDERGLKLMYARQFAGADWETFSVTPKKSDCYYSWVEADNLGGVHIACDTGREIHYAYCADCGIQ
ncbi:MAG TPA: hypothetical protein VL588_04700 [Bdellovibrionota bacterium]|nr:hypothetical protein [Bdellovibrionota bacterium]